MPLLHGLDLTNPVIGIVWNAYREIFGLANEQADISVVTLC
jgi:hypothetical protein